ncbi:hypothetical protein [Roseococcus pinisoli]|uniref:Uncharacterized protein n=1 Tax=Roseococcus pinisoli TaxID=2835040 RepID=A0ABS5QBW7_9PROT|nr:hypothetical protein [Roseococcus pinisoli]MBS7811184.1 hypothetical protein [Roseococcus pinisoli]
MPPDDTLERLLKLETGVGDIRTTLGRLEPVLNRIDAAGRKLETDVARLDGRVSQLPSTLTMIGFVFAVLAAGGVMKFFLG